MSAAFEEITEQALKLSQQERLALANRLLSAEGEGDESAIKAAWEEEVLARVEEIDNGTAIGVPYNEVIRAAKNRRAR